MPSRIARLGLLFMRCHFGTHGTRIELHELQDEPPHNFTTSRALSLLPRRWSPGRRRGMGCPGAPARLGGVEFPSRPTVEVQVFTRLQSSSASRFSAGAAGFLILSQ